MDFEGCKKGDDVQEKNHKKTVRKKKSTPARTVQKSQLKGENIDRSPGGVFFILRKHFCYQML